jgi:hypothetical protein
MSKLDKRLPNDATKFGDHLSIISVGNDVQRFFYFWLKWLLKGASQINMSKELGSLTMDFCPRFWQKII